MADYKDISGAEHRKRTERMWEAEKATRPQSTIDTTNYGIRKWRVRAHLVRTPYQTVLQVTVQ